MVLMCLLGGRAELSINHLEKTNEVNKTVNGTGRASSDFCRTQEHKKCWGVFSALRAPAGRPPLPQKGQPKGREISRWNPSEQKALSNSCHSQIQLVQNIKTLSDAVSLFCHIGVALFFPQTSSMNTGDFPPTRLYAWNQKKSSLWFRLMILLLPTLSYFPELVKFLENKTLNPEKRKHLILQTRTPCKIQHLHFQKHAAEMSTQKDISHTSAAKSCHQNEIPRFHLAIKQRQLVSELLKRSG